MVNKCLNRMRLAIRVMSQETLRELRESYGFARRDVLECLAAI